MPATKVPVDTGDPSLTWREIKSWINSNARGLLEFAQDGFSEVGRGLIIVAGTSETGLAIKCRYIKPEEIADISNEALDLAHQLVGKYDPETEFVVVTIDASSHVTSALVAVDPLAREIVH